MRRAAGQATFVMALVAVAALYLFPFGWMVLTSLKTDREMFSIPPTWIPHPPTLQQFRTVMSDPHHRSVLMNSLMVAAMSTSFAMLLSAPAAYAFARLRYPLSATLFALVAAARMFPPVTLAIPLFMLLRSAGLVNTKAGLIVAHLPLQLTLAIWMLEGFFRELQREVEEAAELDGLGVLGTFLRVALPLSKPAVGVTAIFCFLVSWNEFMFALTLTRGPESMTVPVAIAGYITTFQIAWGPMTASATLYTIPALLFTAAAQRWIVRGLGAGAVKG